MSSAAERVATSVATFLRSQQVVAADCAVPLVRRSRDAWTCEFDAASIRSGPPVQVALDVCRSPRGWRLGVPGASSRAAFGEGDFFRIGLDGAVAAAPTGPSWSLGALRAHLTASRLDLSHRPGITWRVRQVDAEQERLVLEAYDRGGIFDFHVNTEGRAFPPQVPGNYYAAAWAAYVFARMFRRTGDREWLDCCLAALDFVERAYDGYAPARFVWRHSDFDNPAYLETIETLLAPSGVLDAGDLERRRALYGRFREDDYSPTNVFALRFHWHAARGAAAGTSEQAAIDACLRRLEQDQTREGLLHDNSPLQNDAHDLTYHQYSLASLAQGLAWRDEGRARRLFLEGARFSLELATPNGEIAYVGRGANNVYHVASAILAFETAARMVATSDPVLAGQFRRGARLLTEALAPWQAPDGMLPAAMNAFAGRRIAWNHCETPYNALTAAFLFKAMDAADPAIVEAPLPLEACAHVRVMPDSGYAALCSGRLHAVIFGGCQQSYGWSGDMHHSGVAGLAELAIAGSLPLVPILDAPRGADRPTTDLPVFGDAAPFGRGRLAGLDCGLPAVRWSHVYGGAEVHRAYVLAGERLVMVTRMRSVDGSPLDAAWLVSLPARRDPGWSIEANGPGDVELSGPGCGMRVRVVWSDAGEPSFAAGDPVTNPRGLAAMVHLLAAPRRRQASVATCHVLEPWAGRRPTPEPIDVHLEDDVLHVTWSGGAVRFDP